MGILSFFKRKSKQDETRYQNAIDKLNFDVVIAAHRNWNTRLKAYLAGNSNEDFNPAQVACDDKCDLGKWIYGEGEKAFGEEILFHDLKSMHKVFHYTASNVVSMHQSGLKTEAENLLAGDFTKLSNRMILRLEDFKTLRD